MNVAAVAAAAVVASLAEARGRTPRLQVRSVFLHHRGAAPDSSATAMAATPTPTAHQGRLVGSKWRATAGRERAGRRERAGSCCRRRRVSGAGGSDCKAEMLLLLLPSLAPPRRPREARAAQVGWAAALGAYRARRLSRAGQRIYKF